MIKKTLILSNQLCTFFWKILPTNLIGRSRNRIQDVIIEDLELFQWYLNTMYIAVLSSKHKIHGLDI